MNRFYTCDEVAAMYLVKTTTVWEWIKRGKLKAVKIGKQYRIPKDALTEFESNK